MNGTGMLVRSLRGVKGFWSHLRCSGQNDNIFSGHQGLV